MNSGRVPRTTAEQVTWVSAHLPVNSSLYSEQCDEFLRSVVFPCVREARATGWVRESFFVRYGEGGSHIRLRLQAAPDCPRDKLEEMIAEAYLQWTVSAGWPRDLEWKPYTPETLRYGGSLGVRIAERLFDASTTLVMASLSPALSADRGARLAYGLVSLLVTAQALCDDLGGVHKFAQDYAEGYLRGTLPSARPSTDLRPAFVSAYVRQRETLTQSVYAALGQAESTATDGIFGPYTECLQTAARELEALVMSRSAAVPRTCTSRPGGLRRWVLPSYTHMMANRLGIALGEEAFIAFVLSEVLQPSA